MSRLPLSRFLADVRGNVAMIAAICLPVLIVTGGFALDLHRAHSAKTSSQSAVDAAALSAASTRANDEAILTGVARTYLNANLDYHYLERGHASEARFQDNTTLTVELRGVVKTIFMGMIGIDTIPVEISATAVRGTADEIELALVLDNTWSMSAPDASGTRKIDALKSASRTLVDALMAREDEKVRIGVVPYGDYVNVGMGNRDAAWMSVPADVSTTKTHECREIKSRSVCTRGTPRTCTRYRDGVAETYDCPPSCRSEPVTPYQHCPSPSTSHSRWYGCATSRREGGYRLNDRVGRPYPGVLAGSQNCLTPLTPLTDRRTTVTSAINGLVVNVGGYRPETYIPSGLIWGVNLLSPTEPFNQGKAYQDENRLPRKIMVVMTDGENTLRFNPSNGLHQAPSDGKSGRAQLKATNDDTLALCDYAKSKGIEIYSVALAVNSVAARDLLERCATDGDHYFDARDNAALAKAFADIAASIYRVRLVA